MVSGKQLIKNATGLTAAFVARKAMTFVYFTLIARYTSVETTGLYFLLVSFAAVFASLMDFGLTPGLIRESSRDPKQLQGRLNNVLGLKLVLCLLASLSGAFLITILDYPRITRELVYIIVVMMFLESFSDSFYGCLRVHHRMKYEATGLVLGQLLTLAIGGLSLFLDGSIHWLVVALLANQLFNFIFSLAQVIRRLHFVPRIAFERSAVKPLVGLAAPFFVAAFFRKILSADTLLLSSLTDERIVGLFSIPSTIANTFQFIPAAMTAAIFPALSAFHVGNRDKLRKTFETSCSTLLTLIIPLTWIIGVFPEPIIRFVFGPKYLDSAGTLQILAVSLIPAFLLEPIGTLLDACNRQVTNTVLMGVASLLHIGLSLAFIPVWGGGGVAVAFLAGHLFMLGAGLYFAGVVLGPSFPKMFGALLKVLLAGSLMGVSLFAVKGVFPFFLAVSAGLIVYCSALVLLNGMTRNGFDKEKAYGEWLGMARRVFE
jgi:O-antigen/teichoic acid export membrane protein